MKAKLVPITMPGIDLRMFSTVLDQQEINAADAKSNQPTAKFAELVDRLLYADEGQAAFNHLYQAFYFEFPDELWVDFINNPLAPQFRCTYADDCGILSASFAVWKQFIEWTRNQSRETKLLGLALHNFFKNFSYFNDSSTPMVT